MKRKVALITIIVILLTMFTACAKPEKQLSVTELLDLGEKYLLEMNYKQAVVQFLKVIEIEPKNPRGYTGAAEAYIGLEDIDNAIKVLEQGLEQLPDDLSIQAMLNELTSYPEMPADIAKIFQQLSETMQTQNYQDAYELSMNAELIDFSQKSEPNPKCYDVIISPPSPLAKTYTKGLSEMVSVSYVYVDENGNGKYIRLIPCFDHSTLEYRIGYSVIECEISNMKANGKYVMTENYLIEDEYVNIGNEILTGTLIDGLYDGEWVTNNNAAKNGFRTRTDVYSNGKYLHWSQDDDINNTVDSDSVRETDISWALYASALPNYKVR